MTHQDDGGPSRRRYDRRTVLASILAGGTVALAGCGESGDADDATAAGDGETATTGTASGTATRTTTPDGTTMPDDTTTPDGTTTPSEGVVAECSVSATEVAVGEAVQLDASAGQGGRATFDVDGDGEADVGDSDDLAVTVEFDEPVEVTPTVTVANETSTETATCPSITVVERDAPDLACEVSATEVAVGDPVTIDATATENAEAVAFDPTGDGAFDWVREPFVYEHRFDEPGTYTPQVDAGDERVDPVECESITVTAASPSAVCSVSPTEATVGETITIDASDSTAGSVAVDVTGDGTTDATDSTDFVVEVPVTEAGEFAPTVTARSGEATDTATCETITVTEPDDPTAACSVSPTEATVGDEITIDAGESDADRVFFDVDGDGEYELSDGGDFVASFTATSAGEVTPRIRAENGAGEDVVDCETVTVADDAEAIAVVDLPVTATYLRTNGDGALDTEPIVLSEYDISPGDRITLTRLGEFYRGSPFGTAGKGMIGVFSGSDTLRSPDRLHRVTDAIDAGPSIRTSDTYYGGVPTNVLEDFAVATNDGNQRSATVEVPEGATHLFVAAKDNLYDDNEPVTDRYAVKIADGSGRDLTADVDPEESVAFGDRAEGVPDPDVEVDLDPAATYLHTSGEDAADARPINLAALDVSPGDELTLVRLGSFSSGGGYGLLAVFSATETLLSQDHRYRVPGATDAGVDHETSATYRGGEATDIAEDFLVADHDRTVRAVSVTVPDGANYLFAAAKDNLYEDNGDDGFGIGIVTP